MADVNDKEEKARDGEIFRKFERGPGGKTKNRIDCITINKKFRNLVLYSKIYPSTVGVTIASIS